MSTWGDGSARKKTRPRLAMNRVTPGRRSPTGMLPQQHVDRSRSAIGSGCIGIREHGGMLSEILPHARPENRDVPHGVQTAAVDDADATTAMASRVDDA